MMIESARGNAAGCKSMESTFIMSPNQIVKDDLISKKHEVKKLLWIKAVFFLVGLIFLPKFLPV